MTGGTSEPSDPYSLDAVDRELLGLLQNEGRLGVTELGRRVNLSQPAVSARIKRLERAGIITGYRAVVDPARLGLTIHAVIRLRTTHARIPACLEHFAGLPEVVGVYRLTGEDCFLLDVHTAGAARLEAVVDGIARFGPVTTSLVLRAYEPKAVEPPSPERRRP
ncbi:Lrp/AsnC family transcriptional regulator [Actinomadura sp. ATCC 31491]|uniref:Lrp/AsnC family transcriptional regulator n=1 Tax=Actinomadura luzonensis TaxID=2805427 RepID=A0ABT0G8L8_9ACTN|nr:Lrp/AsnC family transcriptional regulator [Actinomadura luzonensis]MCK2220944.1 Lrp/AsnC family transcriptional regulator [Actinomadura luzonensis]